MNVPFFSVAQAANSAAMANMTRGILFISPEELGNQNTLEALHVLASRRRLRRIVIDEVHLIWLSENFRGCMVAIMNLRPPGSTAALARVPLVLMSATVPLMYEQDILRGCRIDMNNLKVMRGSLRRENVAISVSLPPRSGGRGAEGCFDETLKHLGSVFRREENREGRHIICVLTRDAVDEYQLEDSCGRSPTWSGKVEVMRYHAGLTNEEKDAALAAWNRGYDATKPFKLMICTSAFGTGVDAPDVRSVTVVGLTRSLVELAQVLGRIGRDGQPGKLHVVYSRYWHAVCDQRGELAGTDASLLSEVVEWITDSSTCRAMRLDKYLGSVGDHAPCGERRTPTEQCDVCCAFSRLGSGLGRLSATGGTVSPGNITRPSRIALEDDVLVGRSMLSQEERTAATEGAVPMPRTPVQSQPGSQRRSGGAPASQAGGPVMLTPPPSSHVTRTVNIRSPTREEKMSKVSRLRRIAKAVNEHCVPCMLRSGVASHESLLDCGTREHSMQCFKRSCMKCHSPHHFSRDCGVMFKARMNRCFACALKTVHGERFHKHAGTPLNEFGKRDRCIFPSLMSFALGYLRQSGVVEKLLQREVFPSNLARADMERVMMWLVADLSSSPPGIVAVADVIAEEFKLNVGQQNDL